MSHQDVAKVIGQAVTDPEFRQRLFTDAAGTCAGYNLTREEIAALEEIDQQDMEAFAESLPDRLIKGVGGGLIMG